jgi:glycine/D-amino acid oxidase-like deaminating enzyme
MAGLTTHAPDGQFVLGPVPGVAGLLVASGGSGLGVSGPGGIGAALAEAILTGRSGFDLGPFRADRFGPVDVRTAAFRQRCAAARSAFLRVAAGGG